MTTVKNEIFISLLHKHFYLLGRELSFGWEENRLGAGDYPFSPSRESPADIYKI